MARAGKDDWRWEGTLVRKGPLRWEHLLTVHLQGTIHTGERQVLDSVRTFRETGKPKYPVNEPLKA